MELNEYSRLALITDMNNPDMRYYFAQLRLEASEIENLNIKAEYHGHAIDKDDLVKELGDLLWFVNAIAVKYGHTLQNIADYQDIEYIDIDFEMDTYTGLLFTLTNTLYNAYIDSQYGLCTISTNTDIVADYLKRIYLTLEEILTEHKISLDTIMSKNITKLAKRYPEGFSQERSIERDE